MKLFRCTAILAFIFLFACSGGEPEGEPDGLYARINTNRGDILLQLEMEKAPTTTANFVSLAEGKMPNTFKEKGTPYYDGMVFHRVLSNFMIQGGDPLANGLGGPGYKFKDEFNPELRHNRSGILSMANGGPGTNGSQFFITHVPTDWLDDRHSVFGKVVQGQNVVNAIHQGDTIRTVEILRKGSAARNFDAMAVFQANGGSQPETTPLMP